MELTNINKELLQSTREARELAKQLPILAREVAETEKYYRLQLMREIMELREQKFPATLIGDIARGKTADLRYKRDLARETYKANMKILTTLGDSMSATQSILRYQGEV
jgi:hypothetical protein